MKIKNAILMAIAFFFILSILYINTMEVSTNNLRRGFYEISVITRETGSDTYETVRQGMEQAAADFDVEISFVTLTKRNDYIEQSKLLEREINNGTQAVILFAADYNEMELAVSQAAKKAPIIAVESPVASELISAEVLGEDYNMGRSLGERIVYTGAYERKVLLLESSMGCENIQERKRGVMDALGGGNVLIETEKLTNNEDALDEVTQILQRTKPDILVTLEPYSLELVAIAKENLALNQLRLCGIGATGKLAPQMEKGVIDTAIVQNDFNMGYLAIMAAVEQLDVNKKSVNAAIEYAIINSYNMYSIEHQRLLFPFIR